MEPNKDGCEDLRNTAELEEETVALQKKRSRRVSFADTTSVHVFDRDEDLETPSDSKPASELADSANPISGGGGDNPPDSNDSRESSLSHRDDRDNGSGSGDGYGHGHAEDGDGSDDDDEDQRELFVRNMEFSSPGSTVGSVTSNDGINNRFLVSFPQPEDNFFGPVSPGFIKMGRLSTESATLDDNHDVTMDSTAFSMHFRSLMQSDERGNNSGENFKTPSEIHFAFDEKTPARDSMLTNAGSSMVLTGFKKSISQCISDRKSCSGAESNDMSLIVENPHKYDYGRLSPSLDALLSEGQRNAQPIFISNQINASNSPASQDPGNKLSAFSKDKSELMDQKNSDNGNELRIECDTIPAEAVSADNSKSCNEDNGYVVTNVDQVNHFSDSSITKATLPDNITGGHQNQTQNESTEVLFSSMDNDSGKDAPEVGQSFSGSAGKGESISHLNRNISADLTLQQDCGPGGYVGDRTTENIQFSHPSSMPVSKIRNLTPSNILERLAVSPRKRKYTAERGEDAAQDTQAPSPGVLGSLSVLSVDRNALSAAEKNTALVIEAETHGSTGESTMKLAVLGHNGESGSILHDAENKKQKTAGGLINCQGSELMTASFPSFEVLRLEKGMEQQPLSYPVTDSASTPLSQSPQMQTTAEQQEIKQADAALSMILASPARRLDQRTSASGGLMGILPRTSNHQNLTNNLIISSPRQQKAASTGIDAASLTPRAEGNIDSSSLLQGDTELSTAPFPSMNSRQLRSFDMQKVREFKESFPLDLQKELDASGSYQTPLCNRVTVNFHALSQDRNFKRMSRSGEIFLSRRKLKTSPCKSAPLDVSKKIASQTQSRKNLVERETQNASTRETYLLTDADGLHPILLKDPFSPVPLQSLQGHEHNARPQSISLLQRSLFMPIDDSSGNSSSQGIASVEKRQFNDTGRSKSIPELVPMVESNVSGFHSEHLVLSCNDTDRIGSEASPKHWRDVFAKLSARREQLLPISTDKLRTPELSILEDMLGQMQKAKKLENLSAEVKSQKMHLHLDYLQQQRVLEAKWLQYRLLCGWAKLQLLHKKRDRLLKNVQRLQLGIQECHDIKFNILQNHTPSTRDIQNSQGHVHSFSTEFNSGNQDACHKVTRLRKDLEMHDQKLKKLVKYIHSCCKMKGDPSYDETIVLVTDYVEKRNLCMLIRQNLQLWLLDEIGRKDGHRNIVLNYCGLLFQRFTASDGPISNTFSCNLLNNANIRKSFPNMDVSTAFEFVFNAKNDFGLASHKSFRQVTEATSFLLGNLLDVVEEVQAAQMKFRNLISTTFQSPCVGQLELQLTFIDFKMGRKVTLILDMTGLKCGIYPSEILPSQLKIQMSGTQLATVLLPSQILDRVQNLKAAQHSSIIKLCRCVSQVLQASSG